MKYTIKYLEKEEIALTTKDSKILTDILRECKDDVISRMAARNYNCPPEILAEVLSRGNDDVVSWQAAANPNCPTEILAEVLRRGNDDSVSRHAVP